MDENDKKLLQLYKKDIRKKRIIVFLLILIFIGGFSLYYFYIDLKLDINPEYIWIKKKK